MPWLVLFIFLVGLVAASLLLPYVRAFRYSNRYAKAYEAFILHERQFTRLKIEFERKNLEWLIGVRPVLYTDVDRMAQMDFARAYYVTTQGIKLKNAVANRLPGVGGSWKQLLNVGDNLKRISQYRQAIESLEAFSEQQGELVKIRKELDDLPQQLKQKRTLTELQLSRLLPEVTKAENTLKQLETQYRSQVSDGIRWTVDAARKALEAADALITDPHQETGRTEDFAYASAHIFMVIAYNLLDMFGLFAESLIVPSRFQLDHFNQILEAVSEKLRQILILKPPKNWNDLDEAQTYLNSCHAKVRKARASLDDAHKKIKTVEAVEFDLSKINLQDLLAEAKDLQEDCEDYWGTINETPEYWQIALQERALPLERLEASNRDYYQPYILPKQKAPDGSQAYLKQTEIPIYLGAVDHYIDEVSFAAHDIENLLIELSRHKGLHYEVLTRLSEEGDVYEAIRNLNEVRQNGSDESVMRYQELENQFHLFEQRVKKVRGADFPRFVIDLNQFVLACRQLKEQHGRIILEYQRRAKSVFDQLQTALQVISNLQVEEPSIEWDWSLRSSEINQLLDPTVPESAQYSMLRDYINDGEAVLQNANLDQQRYQEEYSMKIAEYQVVFANLQNIQGEIAQRESEVYGGWTWRSRSLGDDLRRATNTVKKLHRAWQDAWQQAKMKDVLEKCDQIRVASDKILVDLDLRLQETDQIQTDFDDKYSLVDSAILSPEMYRLDQYEKVPELLDLLVELIRESPEPNVVAWALDEAELVINQAKWGRLDQVIVFKLITDIRSGRYTQSVTYNIKVGNITSQRGVNIAGRDIKITQESDDETGQEGP